MLLGQLERQLSASGASKTKKRTTFVKQTSKMPVLPRSQPQPRPHSVNRKNNPQNPNVCTSTMHCAAGNGDAPSPRPRSP